MVLSPTGNPVATFEEALQSFVNASFAEALSYEEIRQTVINQLEAAITHHQAGYQQRQQQAQDNLAAVQRGN